MTKTKGLLFTAGLVLAMAFTFSCDSGGGGGGGNGGGGGGGGNSALNGTWVTTIASYTREMTLKDGNFEISFRESPESKGTYTISGNNYVFTPTHVHGGIQGLELKWYSKAEWEEIGKSAAMFNQSSGTYSISGNQLTLTGATGNATTYTRKGSGDGDTDPGNGSTRTLTITGLPSDSSALSHRENNRFTYLVVQGEISGNVFNLSNNSQYQPWSESGSQEVALVNTNEYNLANRTRRATVNSACQSFCSSQS